MAAQIDHVRVSLADLMSRYCPRVSKTRYKVSASSLLGACINLMIMSVRNYYFTNLKLVHKWSCKVYT